MEEGLLVYVVEEDASTVVAGFCCTPDDWFLSGRCLGIVVFLYMDTSLLGVKDPPGARCHDGP